jgi:ABC-type transport system involved in cytochrome bd biosynthesis fused ATPase/permease subunit
VTLVNFMSSGMAGGARMGIGLVMVGVGLALGGAWFALSFVGLVPLAAGALVFCLIAPLFHKPLRATGSSGA